MLIFHCIFRNFLKISASGGLRPRNPHAATPLISPPLVGLFRNPDFFLNSIALLKGTLNSFCCYFLLILIFLNIFPNFYRKQRRFFPPFIAIWYFVFCKMVNLFHIAKGIGEVPPSPATKKIVVEKWYYIPGAFLWNELRKMIVT